MADVIVLYAVWVSGTFKVKMNIGDATPFSVPSGWKNISAGVYEKEALYGDSVKEYISEWMECSFNWTVTSSSGGTRIRAGF